MDGNGILPTSARPERSRGALAQTPSVRPSTKFSLSAAAGGVEGLGTNETGAKREQLKAAAQAFEAVFLRQMIGSMRQAKLGDDILGGSSADQFRDMSDAKLADSMAEKGSFGIAELLLKQFDAAGAMKK
jgi:flagellar protein FlgJ